MKKIHNIIINNIATILILLCISMTSATAQPIKENTEQEVESSDSAAIADSVEVSLLTCSPHERIYSLYGHTALRYHDLRTGEDWAFNYGIFNFKKPFFILRFTFGITDYELGVIPFDLFKAEYKKFGSRVVEQVIDLTPDEKKKIWHNLVVNLQPENKVYRYNFFYDNCTTRARDMIAGSIDGRIEYFEDRPLKGSFRKLIYKYTSDHPWATFGNDLCLGVKADKNTSFYDQQFLPENLRFDFGNAMIYTKDSHRPLVKETRIIVDPGAQIIEKGFPLTPVWCASILLALTIIVCIIEYKKNKTFHIYDILLMLIQGTAGIVILALFFSEHPTTSTNLQILLLNPLPLIFIPSMIKFCRLSKNLRYYSKTMTAYWKTSSIMIIVFIIGGFFQDYAEGIEFVALSLLLRNMVNLKQCLR
ncbi:Lnb N-terminal periplasmic domain-containing protein [Xylanibacter muris]|uniref:DUF4105 domain-containing protein n=1 Tax=Xylanibacter muris TaxID=2736290 RepID=A0ABX2AM41_9BACT|nr:DUF4105 domain-containing protein [Xylanibacter muris]NPD91270.1 DUF4105 domain-containing protein [Xylanibacter muris]